ncbi:hypothetical protein EON68_01120 [archaeon]|nr:MAG: hypothetical protein EON68_01120 [archaeon]
MDFPSLLPDDVDMLSCFPLDEPPAAVGADGGWANGAQQASHTAAPGFNTASAFMLHVACSANGMGLDMNPPHASAVTTASSTLHTAEPAAGGARAAAARAAGAMLPGYQHPASSGSAAASEATGAAARYAVTSATAAGRAITSPGARGGVGRPAAMSTRALDSNPMDSVYDDDVLSLNDDSDEASDDDDDEGGNKSFDFEAARSGGGEGAGFEASAATSAVAGARGGSMSKAEEKRLQRYVHYLPNSYCAASRQLGVPRCRRVRRHVHASVQVGAQQRGSAPVAKAQEGDHGRAGDAGVHQVAGCVRCAYDARAHHGLTA